MTWLKGLVSGGIGGTAAAVGEAAKDIQDVFTTSDREKLDQYNAETRRIEAERADRQGQVDINIKEAAHSSRFVAGWRPFCGWICGIAMLYHFLIFPLVGTVTAIFGVDLLDLDWQELSVVLMGMLGFGALRTYEKKQGVARAK